MKQGNIYIMTNIKNTVIYIGVTNDVERRVFEHKTGIGCAFTKKYNCTKLIYMEHFHRIEDSIAREKQLKNWKSDWKWQLVRTQNPNLKDLSEEWYDKEELRKARWDNGVEDFS